MCVTWQDVALRDAIWVEAADAEAGEGSFHPVDDTSAFADQVFTLTVRTPGVFLHERENCSHAAMISLATQPAEEGTFEQANIKSVSLRPAMLARDRNARGMDDVCFDAVCTQPACQPQSVAAGLEGNSNARDCVASLPAASRQRCSSRNSSCSSDVIFFSGCRFIPGTIPPTSQLDWLSSITATTVASLSKVTKDRLRSFEKRIWHIPWRLITTGGECLLLAGCPIVSQRRRS
jgi:hypothetical protein